MRVIDLSCPGCGAAVSSTTAECHRCGRLIIVTSFSDLHHLDVAALQAHARTYTDGLIADPNDGPVNASLGLCYLKLGLCKAADRHLRVASDQAPLNSELFFYTAIASLGGERPFVAGMAAVREAVSHLGAALRLERRPTYLLTRSYIGSDYFRRKFLNPPFDEAADLGEALSSGISHADAVLLSEILGDGMSDYCAQAGLRLVVS